MAHSPGAVATEPAVRRAVADFYERLVFPSRSSHAEYAALMASRPGERLGDFGCGLSLFYESLKLQQPPPTFLDLSMNALRRIDYGLRVRADLYRLPFPDCSYDRLACIGVLHHLPVPGPVLQEMFRILKPGGKLVLGVYAPWSLPAVLRRLHDASGSRSWRSMLRKTTELSIELRYRLARRRLDSEDRSARTRDFLDVPFVRHASPEFYRREAKRVGLRVAEQRRIAAMNVLVLQRP